MCCTIIVPIIALIGAYVSKFGTINIGYRLLTSAKAVRAVLSTPKEDVEAYLKSYHIFDTEVLTKENEKYVADYYRVLNHLCAIGDVEKMYIPPVYDLS
jgi:sterol 24-C-methyltransferase